jgi:hypothetical protein
MNSSGAGVVIVAAILLQIGLTIWVAMDAGVRGMRAGAWAGGVFVLLIVFLPLYLVHRRHFPKRRHSDPASVAVEPDRRFDAKDGLRAAMALGVVLLALLYFSGRPDPLLYKVGLNYTTCGQNAFGAVFCGDQLTAYNQHLQDVQRQADQAAKDAEAQAKADQAAAQAQIAADQAAAQAQIDQAAQRAALDQQAAICAVDATAAGCP